MDQYRELGNRLRGLQPKTAILYQGIVRSVEGKTCSVEIDGLEIADVRLRATTTEEGEELLITPAVGSGVIVGSLTGDITDLVVLSIDRADTISLHGGKQGGLVLVRNLVGRLNTLEDDLNSLKQALSSWTPIPKDGGASLKASTATWAGQRLIKTQATDLENTKIKQ